MNELMWLVETDAKSMATGYRIEYGMTGWREKGSAENGRNLRVLRGDCEGECGVWGVVA